MRFQPTRDAVIASPLEIRLDAATPERPLALGRYLVLRRIGAGGMGVVYEARDRHGKRVALKIIRGRNPEWLRHLKNEFRSVADIAAPNLAALYELVAENGDWYFTMEFVEGVDFLEHVAGAARGQTETIEATGEATNDDEAARQTAEIPVHAPKIPGALRIQRLRSCLQQLALGVHALHLAGKLHRDLKPTNVLVDKAGRVVVLDFGLVTDGRAKHDLGKIEGTPAYMAPEQARGTATQPASDWYAVGVMLYEALTGQLPFRGSPQRILLAKQRESLLPPSHLAPDVPEDLDELCADLLRTAPAERPTGEEVLHRLGIEAPHGLRHAGHGHRLLGRDAEIAALLEAYANTAPGSPVVQWIHGGSGMGKSALLRGVLAELRRSGDPLILEGRCYACESVPYKAFDAIIDALARELERLAPEQRDGLLPPDTGDLGLVFPVLRGIIEGAAHSLRGGMRGRDINEVRTHAFRALKEILRAVAAQRRLVIAVDDLQWGDVDSAHLLRELLATPGAPGLLFIGVYRSDEVSRSPFLQGVPELLSSGGRDGVRMLALGLLPHGDAARMASELLGGSASAMAEAIAAGAQGNPFLVEAFAHYARRRGAYGELQSAHSPSVERVVLARIHELSPMARRLLEVVAVAGRSLEQRVALAAADLGADAMPVVRSLQANALLRTTGLRDEDAVEVYHDRIRETVVGALAPDVLAQHHRALGQALEAFGAAEPEILARHFLAAGDRARGVPYALRAAERASSALAFDCAAELYQLVLEGCSDAEAKGPASVVPRGKTERSEDERRALTLRRAEALVNAGRCDEAASHYLACARGALPAEAIELRRRAAEQLLVAGRIGEGTEALRDVLSALDISYPATDSRAVLGTVLGFARLGVRGLRFNTRRPAGIPARDRQRLGACIAAARGLGAFDVARGAYFSVEALLLSLRAGEPASVARCLAGVGSILAYGGSAFGLRHGGRLIQEGLDLARRLGDAALVAAAELHLGISQMSAGRWADAITTVDPALRFLRERCGGYGHECGYGEMTAILALEQLGRLREVAWRADACLREAERTGNLYMRIQAHLYLALCRIAADDPRAAGTLARDALALWPPERQSFLFQHWLGLKVLTYGNLYAGQAGVAFERLRDAWPRIEASGLLQLQFLRIFALQLRASGALALAAARPAMRRRLVDVAEQVARRLEREETTVAQAAASRIHAGVAARRGRAGAALERLGDAIAGYEVAGMAVHAAAAKRQRGLLLGGDAGRALVTGADTLMAGEGIARPERWAAAVAPGFD